MSNLPQLSKRRFDPIETEGFTVSDRRQHGLATPDTIVEVVDDEGVQEACEYARDKGLIGFDAETTGLDAFKDEVVLLQMGDQERQYLIWVDLVDMGPVLEVLRDPGICKAGINLKFDLGMLLASYGLKEARASNVADAQMVEQIISCGLLGNPGATLKRTSMGSMVRRWFGLKIPKDKELRTGWRQFRPDRFENFLQDSSVGGETGLIKEMEELRKQKIYYAADDVIHPLNLLKKQSPWIEEFDLTYVVKMEHKFLPILAESEIKGILIDQEKWIQLTEEAISKYKQSLQKLDGLFGTRVIVKINEEGNAEYDRDINYGSWQQLADAVREWMWENYGVDVIWTNKHFKESLERYGRLNQNRIDKLFEPRMEPNPEKPGKRMKVAYPNMDDVVKDWWDEYSRFLPSEAFVLENTESDTFKIMRIIHETPEEKVDDKHITKIGFPPALVDPILDMRAYEQEKDYYGYGWIKNVGDDGRVHADFKQTPLSTGRLSARPNVMNLPRDQRRRDCFIAPEGYLMVGADWSQIEPRITGEISHDPLYMRTYWSEFPGTPGYDRWCGPDVKEELGIYTEIGKAVGIIPPDYTLADTKGTADREPKEDGAEGRSQAKITVLSTAYGTGLYKFWLKLQRDTNQHQDWDHAAKLYYGLFDSAAAAKDALDELSRIASHDDSDRFVWHPHADGYVTYSETLAGRKRFYKSNHPTWTVGRNQPIQGTGADILKHAAIVFVHWLWENDIPAWIVNYVHDEYLVEVEEEYAQQVHDKLLEVMTQVGEYYCESVPITADGYIERHWLKD